MTDLDPASSGRVCPSCGRRVPRKIAVCRCGTNLTAIAATDAAIESDSSSSSASDLADGIGLLLAIVAGVAAMLFVVYWLGRPPVRVPRPPQTLPLKAMPLALEAEPVVPPRDAPPSTPEPGPAATPPAPVAMDTQPAGTAPLEDVVSRVMPAVVLVETPEGRGSGFFVAPDTLLTNVHVVGSRSSVTIRRMDGSSAPARVEATSLPFDIAVLKVSSSERSRTTIPMGSSGLVRVGQEVFAIGSALGTLQNTVTRGIVSGIRQSGNVRLVQTDAAVNPGNSGGPLLDRTGTAIGIATMGYGGMQGLNFAVAIEHARPLVEGRPAAATAAAATAPGLRSLTPAVQSDTERMRADGFRAYEQTLDGFARRAQALDDEWQRFRQSCYHGTIVGAFDHEWFAVLSDRALPGPVAPQCGDYHADLKREAGSFRDAMLRADETARQAGVYPGIRRDARRKYRLEFEGWDR